MLEAATALVWGQNPSAMLLMSSVFIQQGLLCSCFWLFQLKLAAVLCLC